MRKLAEALPAVTAFLVACWMHHKGISAWLFFMLSAIFLLQFYTYLDAGRKL